MSAIQNRKKIRFEPEPNTMAQVIFKKVKFVGLVVNESQSGCRAVFLSKNPLVAGDVCQIIVGELQELAAQVVWRKELGSLVCEMGFSYLEK
jgi:hypothetical protein